MSSIKSEIFKGISAKLFGKYKTSPKEQEQLLREFADSMKLSQGYQGAEAFNDLAKNHIDSIDALAELEQQNQEKPKDGAQKTTKTAGIANLNKKIAAKLKHNDNDAKTFNEALTKALSLTDETRTAQKEYNQCVTTVNQMIKDPDAVFDTAALASYLHEAKNSAVTAIKDQHSKELANLKKIFTNHAKPIKKTLNIEDSQIAGVQDKLTSALQQNHQKQLDAFEKGTESSITALHAEAQNERDRVAFLAMQYQNNKAFRQKIDAEAAIATEKAGGGSTAISIDATTKKVSFKGIKVEDLPVITSITGRKIEKMSDNTFSMNLPNRFFASPKDWGYHSSYRTAREADLMSMAQAVKACGYESIEMDVSGVKPEKAKKLIMDSYAACLKSGFPADKITIKYNGKDMIPLDNKEMKVEDFIKQDPMYASIQNEAKSYNKERQTFRQKHQNKKPTKDATKELKETLNNIRDKERKQTTEPDNQANQTNQRTTP